MDAYRFSPWLSCLLLVLTSGAPGIAQEDKKPALEVRVLKPLLREVTDYEIFSGRVAPAVSVEIRARVSGYLTKVHFRDGAEVQQGERLFDIDPRPYEAELAKAEAVLAVSEARRQQAEAAFKRANTLLAASAISKEDYDKVASDRVTAEAEVRVARVGCEIARLNVDFTRVAAPVKGRIGRRLLDPGNLVKSDETILAVLTSPEPMYVYFNLDERTVLRLNQLERDRPKDRAADKVGVAVQVAGEEGYPHQGTVDFTDSRVDPQQGTIQSRAVLDNSNRLFVPGMFARVRLATSAPYKALLVPEKALVSVAETGSVFIVNAQDELERRKVETGARFQEWRVVKSGLTPEDRIVVDLARELQEAFRPKMKVRPQPARQLRADPNMFGD
jgi:RND family efflux transporter MFP subunit